MFSASLNLFAMTYKYTFIHFVSYCYHMIGSFFLLQQLLSK